MGLDVKATLNRASHGVDLCSRYDRWHSAQPDKVIDARSREHGHPLVEVCQHKHIIWKQRQRQVLHPVFPAVDSLVKREENFHSFARYYLRNSLFMPVPGINGKPGQWRYAA